MNFSSWSIRNPIVAVLLFLLLTLAGLKAFSSMQIQRQPDMEFPMVTIAASLQGATPGQLENDVARKIENALTSVQGVRHTTTTLSDGAVAVMVQFELEKPVQEALDDVRSAVQSVRADLPSELPDPVVSKVDVASQPILTFAVQSDRLDMEELSWFVDNELNRKLLALKGVGKVTRVGGVDRQVHVDLNPVKLRALGLTAGDVSTQLKNNQIESAGGRADISESKQPLRILSRVKSAAQLEKVQITTSDGRRLLLRDLGTVKDTVEDPSTSAWLDGRKVVGFEVNRARDQGEVDVGARVRDLIHRLNQERPELKFTETFDLVSPALEVYDGAMEMLYEGAFLAVVVVWLFLRNWRATLVSAVALPMSVLPAFLGMYLFGFTLNVVSLLALMLVIGVLVDDAIVEIENIERHLGVGKTPYQAAMEAADEIGLAVVATTFTLIAVFLPTAFMSGIVGRFFKQFGWTASLAVFASLVVARLLTPMMAASMLRPRMLPQAFQPDDDNDQTQVQLTLGPGATLEQTERLAERAREKLVRLPHVKRVYTAIGAGSDLQSVGSNVKTTNTATLSIDMGARDTRPNKKVVEASMRKALSDLPGARIKVGFGGAGQTYAFAISGNDQARLQMAVNAVDKSLRALKGVGNTTSSVNLVRTEVIVRPRAGQAATLGVTSQAISDALRIATQGDYTQLLPKLNLDQRQIDIVVRLNKPARQSLEQLRRIVVQGNDGAVMLGQVADLELGGGPATISRYDRERNVDFTIELGDKGLGDVVKEVSDLPAIKQLPAGVHLTETGDAEMMAEMFSSFGLAMLAGVLCIWVVLVLLFRSFLHPVTILSALPLAIGGSFVSLLLAKYDLSLPVLIGLITLMGIVTKNSILLVEYAIMARRDHGMDRWHALMDACHKRARPIIMTTMAMAAGMMPILLGTEKIDLSFPKPMAMTVLGGLITSTALSLLVVPAVFTYIDDFGQWMHRLWHRFGPGHHHHAEQASESR